MKIIITLMTIAFTLSSSMKAFAFLQQRGYKFKLCEKTLRHYAIIAVTAVILSNVYGLFGTIITNKNLSLAIYLGIITAGCVLFWNNYLKCRVKFKFTKRGIRLFILTLTLETVIVGLFTIIKNNRLFALLVPLSSALVPFYVYLSNFILSPFEKRKNKKFVALATKKLNEKSIIKIGITGSFGKTGCKNILAKLLSRNYNVTATPESYNTPMGIALTADKVNLSTDVFIAEMGARNVGDIAELCDMVRPELGIITGVAKQHLETFLTVDNIYKEKFVLAESLYGEDTLCVFNAENRYSDLMYHNYKKPKIRVGFTKGDIRAENIIINESGSSFELVIKGRRYEAKTRLLGKHNIINILLCVAIATKMKVSDRDIVELIEELNPVKHRMELIKSGDITIIDDSYNANVEGVKYALETLGCIPKRKVVLSQGLVELGVESKTENIVLGGEIGRIADVAVFCGSNAELLKKGFLSRMPKNPCIVCKDLPEAQKMLKEILKKGDVLLIQNDLPDIY